MDSPGQKGDKLLLEELETKRQELYTAQRNVETLTANIGHLEFENAELKKDLAQEAQKHKDSQSQDQSRNDLLYRQQIADLQLCLEEAQAGEKIAKEESQRLEQQLKHVIETSALVAATTTSNDDEEEMERLRQHVTHLEEEKTSLQAKLLEATMELQKKMDELTGLKREIEEKDEEMECMETQFSTQCNINERLRKENQELRAELESQAGQVDTRKKGNSLFSEVDDRRIAAENKLVKLTLVVQDLEQNLTKEQKENKRLKHQVLLLRQTASKGYDGEMVKNLQRQLEESKRKEISLTEQLQKREPISKPKAQPMLESPALTGATDSEKLFINYLQGIVAQKQKEVQETKTEVEQSRMQLLRSELHLTEAKNEVMNLTHECQKLKVMNSHLSMTIQEMQHKYEPERFAPPSKDKIKISTTDNTDVFSSSKEQSKRQSLQPLDAGQDRFTVDTTGESDKQVTGEARTNGKENLPAGLPSELFRGKSSKSVRIKTEVDTLTDTGTQSTARLRDDGKGEKLKKTGSGTGKFRSVTYSEVDSQAPDCKQQ